ncbi:hypothetical protein J4440_05840 [Candidatus Woesearchaeota archaeon]|nr:hypothetical protein [Candidatus Woesearchaeota archaeon]
MVMDFFRRPSTEDLEKEVLEADRLISEAEETESLSTAIPYLQSYLRLVRRSKQKDIYEPEDIQTILGDKLAGNIIKQYKDLFFLNLVPGTFRIEVPREISLDAIIDEEIRIHEEVANGLMNKDEVKKQAHRIVLKKRQELKSNYEQIFLEIINTAEANILNNNYPMARLIDDYESNLLAYTKIGGIGTPVVEKEGGKISLSKILYEAAITNSRFKIEQLIKTTEFEEEFGLTESKLNVTSNQFSNMIDQISTYAEKAKISTDEQSKLDIMLGNYRNSRQSLIGKNREAIEALHDNLYNKVNEEVTIDSKVDAFRRLMELTFLHREVLEIEDPKPLIDYSLKLFKEAGYKFIKSKNELILIAPDEKTYETGLSVN